MLEKMGEFNYREIIEIKDSRQRFTGLGKAYAEGRPEYSSLFVNDLYEKYGVSEKSIIADIGSGTGKLSFQLVEKSSCIYLVEPNKDMREQAEKLFFHYKTVTHVDGSAEYTNLLDNCIDFIIVAQAFHWFDVKLFKKECRRILKENGKVFLVWNRMDYKNTIVDMDNNILRQYIDQVYFLIPKVERKICTFFEEKYEYVEYDNPIVFTKDKFVSWGLSIAESFQKDQEDQYKVKLNKLFEKYSKQGVLEVANKTVVYFGGINYS